MPSLSAVILRGTRAAQPSANAVAEGSLYYVTDENKTERSNGSSWDTYNDASGAATDHGLLTGLTDDDHPQYLLTSDATSRANFAAKWADLTAGPDSNLVDANVTQEPWEFILPGTGITVTIEGDSGSAARLAVDSSVVVTQDNANWVDLTDGGATTLHSHSGGAYDSTVPSSQSDFVEAADTIEDVTDLIYAGSNITITELGTRGAISIASSAGGSTVGDCLDIQFIRKAADETVNNSTTFQNDDDFTLPIGASEVWEIEYVLNITTNFNSDFKWAFTYPASCAIYSYSFGPATTLTSTASEGDLRTQVITTPGSGVIAGAFGGADNGGDNTFISAMIKLLVVNSTNAGNIVLQWAQLTAGSANCIVRTGSYMVAKRFA